MTYINVGNLEVKYEHEPRTVRPRGLVTTPSLVLKLYSMAQGRHPASTALGRTRKFLEKEIAEGKIDPLTGMGFAILSDDMLNVARWDRACPIVLKNQLYEFKGTISSAKQLDVREAGSFCVWELGIVSHEREAWKRYLDSPRGESEKDMYLRSLIEGGL